MKEIWKVYIICGLMTFATCIAGVWSMKNTKDISAQNIEYNKNYKIKKEEVRNCNKQNVEVKKEEVTKNEIINGEGINTEIQKEESISGKINNTEIQNNEIDNNEIINDAVLNYEIKTESLSETLLEPEVLDNRSIELYTEITMDYMIIIDRVHYSGLTPGCEYSIRGMLADSTTGEYIRYEDICISDRMDFISDASEGFIDLQIVIPEGFNMEHLDTQNMCIQETLYITETHPEDGAISQMMLAEHNSKVVRMKE